jgi:Chitin binding Peritrophin-A domain
VKLFKKIQSLSVSEVKNQSLKMIAAKFLRCICVILIFELAAAQFDDRFCFNEPDGSVFPNSLNCADYLMCYDQKFEYYSCPEGQLFDPVRTYCNDADLVNCYPDSKEVITEYPEYESEECPPPGSSELRYITATNCNEYYICINGEKILLACGPGLHWNHDAIDPSRGWYRFKNFQQCDWFTMYVLRILSKFQEIPLLK